MDDWNMDDAPQTGHPHASRGPPAPVAGPGRVTVEEVEDEEEYSELPMQAQGRPIPEAVAGLSLHKRTMSAGPPRPPPKTTRQGFRSLQAGPKQMQTQRRLAAEVEDFDDGPFWKPR